MASSQNMDLSKLSLSSQLHPTNHYGPVTALKFHQELVVCGYGPYLKIFSVPDGKLVQSHQVFKRNKIHCISINDETSQIIVSGGNSFSIIDLNDISRNQEKSINEWIIATEYLDQHTVLILTSHNVIYKMNSSTFAFDKIHCNEKSILYSGSIYVGDRILIAAGTVMDGVIIWDLSTRQIVHNLKHHKGSIFGVQINKSGKYIATCSDDRSIKLYDYKTGDVLGEGWGHGSRIWHLCFLNTDDIRLISMGEDCTMRIWHYDSNELRQVGIKEGHLGKHIWSGDCNKANTLAITGGADGKVIAHCLRPPQLQIVSLQNWPDDSGSSDVIKQFVHVSNKLIVLTKMGTLVDSETAKLLPLEESETPKLMNLIMKANDETIFVQNQQGDLLVMDINSYSKKWYSRGFKVTNLLVDGSNILSISPDKNVPYEFRMFSNDDCQTIHLHQQLMFTPTCLKYDQTNNWVMVFGRNASLIIYDLGNNSHKVFKKILSGDTITSASILQSRKGFLQCFITIRDGVYGVFNLTDIGSLELVHSNKVAKTLEGSFFDEDLILYGFKSGYFFVWNETKQFEIAKRFCGGGHRLWQFCPQKYQFAYINDCTLLIDTFHTTRLLNEGTHGREIRGVSICPQQEADGSRLVLTASEDTVIRLGKINKTLVTFFWSMNYHVSGMQDVKFMNGEYAGSCAANEEFFLWKIDRSGRVPFMKQYAVLKPSTTIPDLRIMDFTWKETPQGFMIITIYSDSGIKVWSFGHDAKSFTLLGQGHYTTACLLNVDLVFVEDVTYLLTSATDGHIAVWKFQGRDLGKPLFTQKIHQSGIQGLVLFQDRQELKLVTGGDDNALVVSSLDLDELSWTSTYSALDAASATITSISKVNNKVVVTSVDQVVKLWLVEGALTCDSQVYTTVADTSCCDHVDGVVVIGGAGLSVYNVYN